MSSDRYLSGYGTKSSSVTIAPGGVSVRYAQAGDTVTGSSDTIDAPYFTLDLQPLLRGTVVEGSLRFKLGGYTYIDREGVLYHSVNTSTGSGTIGGSINYATGVAKITSWTEGANNFVLESGLINPGTPGVSVVVGHADVSPLKSQSFSVNVTTVGGATLNATAAADGTLTADGLAGTIDVETGIYAIRFGETVDDEWVSSLVDPSTMRYNAVSYSYLPLNAEIVGLDPVRLPSDGKVPIFRPGGFAVIGNTQSIGPATVINGQTINCSRVRLSRVRVIGGDGAVINTGYSADLEGGTVTFSDVAGYAQPVTIEHRVEDMVQVSDVQISGQLTFTRQITHDYPAGSTVSSALVAGDLYAHSESLFDQATWANSWADEVSGSSATGTYNATLAPIEVTNAGCTNERWAIVFTNTTSFNVMGEHVGVIATGNTSTDLAPVNPATGEPYFTLRATGWGTGWSAGNVLRFNTVGALFPVWVVRTIQQGQETVTDDSFTLLVRGDVNA